MIHVRRDLVALFAEERRVADFERIACRVVRRFKNRHTGRFERGGRGFYIKYHGPSGLGEALWELFCLRLPSPGARVEWTAIQRLDQLGVRTTPLAAFGEEGKLAATRRSFVVTDDVAPSISLEDLAKEWSGAPPPARFRHRLVRAVAGVARTLHASGLNHRDLYICHLHLATPRGLDDALENEPALILMDLHRMQARRRTPARWAVKDVAALHFSSLDAGLRRTDLLRFVSAYSGSSPREALASRRRFWRRVEARALDLYRRFWRREPPRAV